MNALLLAPAPVVRRALLALLAAAVLCAQWVGVQHRVEHADRLAAVLSIGHAHGATPVAAPDATTTAAAASNEPASWHDCAAFDHAALGDGPPTAAPSCAPLPSPATRVADHSSSAGAAPRALGYLSRAPPRG